MICPDCKPKTEMELLTSIYSWKDEKPLFCLEEHKCPECGARVRTSFTVESYRSGKDAKAILRR